MNFAKLNMGGRLTRDIEQRFSASGLAVGNGGIAWNTKRGGKDKANFMDFTVFGKTCDTLVQYTKKGDSIFLFGDLEMDSWEKDGVKRSKLKMNVNSFEFGNNPKKEQPQQPEVPDDVAF